MSIPVFFFLLSANLVAHVLLSCVPRQHFIAASFFSPSCNPDAQLSTRRPSPGFAHGFPGNARGPFMDPLRPERRLHSCLRDTCSSFYNLKLSTPNPW